MSEADIKQTIADYAQAAKNAIAAGFDGVEFHAANGYLPKQFLSDSANLNQDGYGGSIENKARFTLEAMQAIIDAVGSDKVGIKAGTGYTKESGEAELEKAIADLIAYGSSFLANPDLPRRFLENAALNPVDRATMFGGGEQGYIDYPFMD